MPNSSRVCAKSSPRSCNSLRRRASANFTGAGLPVQANSAGRLAHAISSSKWSSLCTSAVLSAAWTARRASSGPTMAAVAMISTEAPQATRAPRLLRMRRPTASHLAKMPKSPADRQFSQKVVVGASSRPRDSLKSALGRSPPWLESVLQFSQNVVEGASSSIRDSAMAAFGKDASVLQFSQNVVDGVSSSSINDSLKSALGRATSVLQFSQNVVEGASSASMRDLLTSALGSVMSVLQFSQNVVEGASCALRPRSPSTAACRGSAATEPLAAVATSERQFSQNVVEGAVSAPAP
mmetsp:Transcript_48761/g.110456  ORF Transcript_48761/g.110456 Transcript_48761/m.110456 type:complete len:295 (+) Transcript_48761:168-1052(+)